MRCLFRRRTARAAAVAARCAPATRGFAAVGAIALMATGVQAGAPHGHAVPGIAVPHEARRAQSRAAAGAASREASAFRRIILPDLLIVAPKGITNRQLARLGKVTGVRNMITFDGAEIRPAAAGQRHWR